MASGGNGQRNPNLSMSRASRKHRACLESVALWSCSAYLAIYMLMNTRAFGKNDVEGAFDLDLEGTTDVFLSKIRRSGAKPVFHLSKEAIPLVSFGGVGQIVGDLARVQGEEGTNFVGVILPKYGFLDLSRISPLAKFSFVIGRRKVSGKIFHALRDNVHFVLIGPPSMAPTLWSSSRVEDSYNCPKGFKPEDRDLYFTFVASKIIEWSLVASGRHISVARAWCNKRPHPMVSEKQIEYDTSTSNCVYHARL